MVKGFSIPGKDHVLGDALSRILSHKAVVNVIEELYVEYAKLIEGYDDDQFFGAIVQTLNDNYASSTKKRLSLKG